MIEHLFYANCLLRFDLDKLLVNYKSGCVINDTNFVEAGRVRTDEKVQPRS